MDFEHSPKARALIERMRAFIDERVRPAETEYRAAVGNDADWRTWRQPAVVESLKREARAAGLWNLFLPDAQHGAGLTNVDYAPLAELCGSIGFAAEVFNGSAPDSGNMEVLAQYGTPAQRSQWLEPLLAGEIRSAFCMTEPDVASSDATNMQATARIDGDEIVLDGRKWWSSGIGHPHCRVAIFMGLTDPAAERHRRHSMVLVPLPTRGVTIRRMLPVFGDFDAPHGHGEVEFDDVRLPLANVIGGPGRGFEIAQGRLGPGRIHHCMRLIGIAERALELLCARATTRHAFGQPLARLGANVDIVANARIAIEQARLLTLKAAWMIDTLGVHGAMSEIAQIKVVAPNVAQQVIDAAIQIHGGMGVSDDVPLARLYAHARVLRLADGPDEVHRASIAKLEYRRQSGARPA